MPGFYISNIFSDKKIDNIFNEKSVFQTFENKRFDVKRNTINKFLADKVFEKNDSFVIIVEGVVLNKKKLMSDYIKESFFETIISMYLKQGEEFFGAFRGTFSGALYDKKKNKWIIYTNHFGDKPVFYFSNGKEFIIASDMQWIVNTLKEKEIKYSLNRKAMYNLLSFGFMVDDCTLVTEIKRLGAGQYINYTTSLLVKSYHNFVNTVDIPVSEKEIISELNTKFTNAIRLEFEKDIEYNYQHLAQLSGGLDSRMTVWAADVLGYHDVLCTTFTQSNKLEEKIAKEVALKLNKEHMIKTLDAANFMKDIDDAVKMNHALSMYLGVAHGNSMNKWLDFDKLGLLHTGQIGDVAVGTFSNKTKHVKVTQLKGAYSKKLIKLSVDEFSSYENEEMFLLYTRAFRGALCSHIAIQNYTEVTSPFLNVELLEYCLSIPLKYRLNHSLYFDWIIQEYPDASKIKWEKTNAYITDNNFFVRLKFLFGKCNHLDIMKYFAKKFNIKNNIISKRDNNSMNPVDYWLINNERLQESFSRYFVDNIENSIYDAELRGDISNLFLKGNGTEKILALTALAGVKLFFGDK